MRTLARVTLHDLGALEREFLGALFTRAGGVTDREFALAGTATAAARGLRAQSVIALTDAGLVIELENAHAE